MLLLCSRTLWGGGGGGGQRGMFKHSVKWSNVNVVDTIIKVINIINLLTSTYQCTNILNTVLILRSIKDDSC